MKKKFVKLSLVASVLLAGSQAYASDTLAEAFENGKADGAITVYGQHQKFDKKDLVTKTKHGYSIGELRLGYTTDSFKGFSARGAFVGRTLISEEVNGDATEEGSGLAERSLFNEGYVSYANDSFGEVKIGRMEMDLEWMGDFHEAASVLVTAIPDSELTVAYSQRTAVADIDEFSKFARFNEDEKSNGAVVVDYKFLGLDGFVFNPFYANVDKVLDFYGAKATYENDLFNLTAHYVATNPDEKDAKDGAVMNLEAGLTYEGFSASVGYIGTDKNGAAGMDVMGDNMDPLEDGDIQYGADENSKFYDLCDVDMMYGTLGYEISGFEFGALYADVDYKANNQSSAKEMNYKEIDLNAGYNFNDNLAFEIIYANVENKDVANADNSHDTIKGQISYSF